MPILFFLMLIYHKQYRITGPQYGGGGGGLAKGKKIYSRKGKLNLKKFMHAN